ncbi:hypothetical protein L3Q82_003596 [Scortum barcoo]|uniref:Uncharacterized protein n=1 Tax=Scortum barcoo TaxID=214431 RepID=A0ACB8VN52_9TELE|nr:hypothetical protein L3Q82_003596 [Scortum barcoo]
MAEDRSVGIIYILARWLTCWFNCSSLGDCVFTKRAGDAQTYDSTMTNEDNGFRELESSADAEIADMRAIPMLWKTSCLVPVPKKSRPSDPADYRPVALTSNVMKVLERLVLAQLRPQVRKFLDPLQFAYQPHLGVDDAVIYLLQRAHMHLDGGGGTVRITFFDFSSAFNTIQLRCYWVRSCR